MTVGGEPPKTRAPYRKAALWRGRAEELRGMADNATTVWDRVGLERLAMDWETLADELVEQADATESLIRRRTAEIAAHSAPPRPWRRA